jgi:trk system potassium uptake protein
LTWTRMSPSQRIALSYLVVALLGALFLMLPICRQTQVSFTDACFTSASALYVTGLSSVVTKTTWTPVGDFVIALLIQIGGAGITLVTTSIYLVTGRKITLGDRMFIAEDKNFQLRGIVRLMKSILYFSFAIEGTATVLFALYFHFVYHYSWLKALAISAFHSVSAFNNAGFDVWGNNLEGFQNDAFVLLLTSLLIILGGIGFLVLVELYNYRRNHQLSLHTKIVLKMTGLLLVVGTLLTLVFEAHGSMAHLSWPSKVLNAWFTSVTTRTAGFDSVPIGNMHEVTWMVLIILMFIGASPSSTGGGIKTTTFFMLIKTAMATIRGSADITVSRRTIPWHIAHKSLVIFLLGMGVVVTGTLIGAVFEPGISLLRILFEEVSAFGTVGLTTGITGIVGVPMKWVIIFTMYLGRIGIFTFLMSIVQKRQSKVRYVEEKILIG